jgi:Beta-propeller repeat
VRLPRFGRIYLPVMWLLLAPMAYGQLPIVDLSTYLGGSATDTAYSVTTDKANAIYIAGFTQSPDLPLVHPFQSWIGGGTGDLFVAKFNPDGTPVYTTYIGGSGGEGDLAGHIGGIAVDDQGNVYIAGVTRSPNFPTTAGSFQPTIASQFVCDADPQAGLCGDAFVFKLNAAGDKLLYSTFLGGRDYDDAKAVALDASGAVYITGVTASSDFPVTSSAFQSTLHDVDAYVAKLSSDGSTLLYSTFIGGTGFDVGTAIAVDPQGRAYVAGSTESPNFPTRNAVQTKNGDSWDAFVLRVNAEGNQLDYSTVLGGDGTQQAFGIALDKVGDVYVVGSTDSSQFPVEQAFQPDFGGGDSNGFVSKLRGDGKAILYSTFVGGADGATVLNAITVDSAGSAYVTGCGGSDYPVVNSSRAYSGNVDAAITKLAPDGSGVLYSTYLGGSARDEANGIALSSNGLVVVAGQTLSQDFPVTANARQRTLAGLADAFISKVKLPSATGPIFSAPKLIQLGQIYRNSTSVQKSVRVQNTGPQTLHVTQITSSSNLIVSSDCTTLSPAATCTISASIVVGEVGDKTGTITIFDNAMDSPQTISVRAKAIAGGDLQVSVVTGTPFSFYGKRAIPGLATIVNLGPSDTEEVVLRVTSSGATSDCDPCYVGPLRAGALTKVRFNIIPAEFGMISAIAKVESAPSSPDLNLANNAVSISISNPRYRTDPAQLIFPDQIVGTVSAPRRITFTSLDGNALQLSVSGSTEFYAAASCSPSGTVCFVDASFAPVGAGTRTASFAVSELSLQTNDFVQLSGTGLLAPHSKLSVDAITFAISTVGDPTVPQSMSISNDGSAPLFLVAILTTGDFSQTNKCPASLAPGATCTVTVLFTPSTPGVKRGELNIYDNTRELVHNLQLSGTGMGLIVPTRPSRPSAGLTATSSASRLLVSPRQRPTAKVIKRSGRMR